MSDKIVSIWKIVTNQKKVVPEPVDFQPDLFDLSGVNRVFGVAGPCDTIRHSFETPKPKKSAYSQKGDPFYRLGLNLKKLSQSGIE